jgi:hypothetical protein
MYDQKKKDLLMDMAKEIKYDAVHVDFLSERDTEILINIGIPDSISPYIDIVSEEKYGGHSLYDRVNIFEKQPVNNEEFNNMCLFGKNDRGYLVITSDGEVKLFDIEEEELVTVNKSLDAFLDSAYEYVQFINSIIEKNGEDAFMDGDYSIEDVESLREALTEIDDTSVEDGFWADELVNLIDCIEG